MLMPLILAKFSHLRQFYKTEKEFIDHLLSGEVQMSIKDITELLEYKEEAIQSTPISTLVSFGNYLFDRYNIKVYSDERANVPLYNRQVTDADIQNWQVGQEVRRKLPSAHQIGSIVELHFGETIVKGCRIVKVHFTESKVLYDVDVTVVTEYSKGDSLSYSTRLYNIESDFVIPAS